MILVWQQYGQLYMYNLADPTVYAKVCRQLISIFTEWNDSETALAVQRAKTHQQLVNAVSCHVHTHETFERFELMRI